MTDIAGERARLADVGLDIILRETWGARQDYTSDRRVNRPARWLFLHITVTPDPIDTPTAEAAACRQVEAIGQARFGIGWSYNAGAFQSGRLYEGQPLTRRGAHTVNDLPNPQLPPGSLNYDARAIAIVQNVSDPVTGAQVDAIARWGAALRLSGEATRTAQWYGHRDVTQKSCPGPIAYGLLPKIRALTDLYTLSGLSAGVPAPVPSRGDDPMIYELVKSDGFTMVVLLSGGKQVRLDGQVTANNVKQSPSYIGQINEESYDRLVKAYGPPVSD